MRTILFIPFTIQSARQVIPIKGNQAATLNAHCSRFYLRMER